MAEEERDRKRRRRNKVRKGQVQTFHRSEAIMTEEERDRERRSGRRTTEEK